MMAILALVLAAGCEKTIEKETYELIIPSDYAKKVESHLSFESQDKLNALLDDVNLGRNAGTIQNPSLGIEGFTSIADRIYGAPETKGMPTDEQNRLGYTISLINDLLPPEDIKFVMDTNLIIGVGDQVYKITQYGTFRFPSGYDEGMIADFIRDFDGTRLPSGQWQEETYGDVTLLNTYGIGYDVESVPEEQVETKAQNQYPIGPLLQNGYNTERYFWGWKWLGNDLFGVNQSKESYWDDSHRVKFQFWNLNFGFYATAGFKVKAEKKTKFLFVEYWTDMKDEIQDMVIGINYLDFFHQTWGNYGTGFHTQSFAPANFPGFSTADYMTTSGNYRYLSGYGMGAPYIEDFSDTYLLTVPYLKMAGVNPTMDTRDFTNTMFNATTRELYNLIEKTRLKFNKNKEYPCTVFMPNTSGSEFSQSRSIISGLQHYRGVYEKEIKLVHYGLFIIGYNGRSDELQNYKNYTFEGFKAGSAHSSQGIDIFGAIKWKNKWTGVNFYGKETQINSFAIF